jgi:hypothetical protein
VAQVAGTIKGALSTASAPEARCHVGMLRRGEEELAEAL